MLAHQLAAEARLAALEPWRAAEFADHVERERAHLAPWVPFATAVTDIEAARELLQRYADSQAVDRGRIYGIWLDGLLVGGTMFRTFEPDSGICELGVWLAPCARGRGLITTAARHMIDWAFRVRGLVRVEWLTPPANTASIAVAKRLGMTREGLLRNAYSLNGVHHDLELWSLLATDPVTP